MARAPQAAGVHVKGREAALRCRHSGSRTPSQGVEPQPSGPPASAPSPPLCDRGRTRLVEKMTSHQNSGWQAALGVCAAALRALGGPETSGSDCPSALARHLPLLLGPRGTGRCAPAPVPVLDPGKCPGQARVVGGVAAQDRFEQSFRPCVCSEV